MEIREWELLVYVSGKGAAPFSQWLEGLKDVKTRAIVRTRLNRIRLGNFGDSKCLFDHLYELRVDYGPGYRVYFGLDKRIVIILLYGGDKSTQKSDIKKAAGYWEDYKRRA